VHGNEPCGFYALKNLLQHFANGTGHLHRGTLTLVFANIRAFIEGKQHIDHNLNRLFIDSVAPSSLSVELTRAAELRPLYADTDYLLDLHSTTAPTIPFAMCEESAFDFAKTLGFSPLVVGWGALGAASITGDTETYCNSKGGIGITLECGQRDWPGGADYAYSAIHTFLNVLGMCEGTSLSISPSKLTVYRIKSVFSVRSKNFEYAKSFQSFDPLEPGELIGQDEIGPVYAPQKCIILMPANPKERTIGQDLYLLATR
jgi:predicted deacylase